MAGGLMAEGLMAEGLFADVAQSKRLLNRRRKEAGLGYLMLAPSLLIFSVFV
ncbi:MAG: hypothetical protein RLY23_284, partial [Actinomycetota bacterium]